MADLIDLSLRPDAPLPLYHQIVVALRYRIATGNLEGGRRLPPLREAAVRWDVSYHTVRRAYAELEELGLVQRRRGAGTTVVASLPLPASPGDATCTVVECNAHQCADLAGQIRRRFAVEVAEQLLGSEERLPPGPIVGTYFHFAEMHRAWPERRADMYFPTVDPDPHVKDRLLAALEGSTGGVVPVCEREGTLAEAMADEMARLADGVEFVPTVDLRPEELRESTPDRPVLVAPRLWGQLSEALRGDPKLIELRYVFRAHDLDEVASALGWNRRDLVRA